VDNLERDGLITKKQYNDIIGNDLGTIGGLKFGNFGDILVENMVKVLEMLNERYEETCGNGASSSTDPCANLKTYGDYHQDVENPPFFMVAVNMKDSAISNQKILDSDPRWGAFRLDMRKNCLDSQGKNHVLIKMKSDIHTSYAWLLELPSCSSGELMIQAKRFNEDGDICSHLNEVKDLFYSLEY
jgi:hypothetical protein